MVELLGDALQLHLGLHDARMSKAPRDSSVNRLAEIDRVRSRLYLEPSSSLQVALAVAALASLATLVRSCKSAAT